MNLAKYKSNYNQNGFIIIRNLLKKKQIEKISSEIEIIKLKAEKTKNNLFFHKTKDSES